MRVEQAPVSIKVPGPDGKRVHKEVAKVPYKIYDVLSEAIDDLGEDATLSLINAQVKTNEMNRVRPLYREGGITKTAIKNKALKLLSPDFWVSLASIEPDGRQAAIDREIEKNMAQAEKELREAAVPVNGTAGGEEDDDEE